MREALAIMLGSLVFCTLQQSGVRRIKRKDDSEERSGRTGSLAPTAPRGHLMMVALVCLLTISSLLFQSVKGDSDGDPCICNETFYKTCPADAVCQETTVTTDLTKKSTITEISDKLEVAERSVVEVAKVAFNIIIEHLSNKPASDLRTSFASTMVEMAHKKSVSNNIITGIILTVSRAILHKIKLLTSTTVSNRDYSSKSSFKDIANHYDLPTKTVSDVAKIVFEIMMDHLQNDNKKPAIRSIEQLLGREKILEIFGDGSMKDVADKVFVDVTSLVVKTANQPAIHLPVNEYHDPEHPDHIPLEVDNTPGIFDDSYIDQGAFYFNQPNIRRMNTYMKSARAKSMSAYKKSATEGEIEWHRKVYVAPRQESGQDVPIHPIKIRIPVKAPQITVPDLPAPKPLYKIRKYTTYENKPEIQMVPVTKTIIKPVGVSADQIIDYNGQDKDLIVTNTG